MKSIIETNRLYIRELLPEDEKGMFEMDSDPEVHKYIGQSPYTKQEETRNIINYIRQQYAENGIGRWAVIEKENNDFLGWVGFKLMDEWANGHINHYDFGYRLARKAWGKGIATEAGRASLQYGVETLGFNPVYAMTDVHNGASRHILEKLGFRFIETFKYDKPASWRRADDLMATWYEYLYHTPERQSI